MILRNAGQPPFRFALLGATCLLAPVAYASTCSVGSPTVTITSPGDGQTTSDGTIDVTGQVSGLCALADVNCGTAAEAISVQSRFLPTDDDKVWNFECTGVALDLALPGADRLNEIAVVASGFDASGLWVEGETTTAITHQGPLDIEPPTSPGGFPVKAAYTKSKVTWNHHYADQDAFSTNARLSYPDGEPFPLPCAPGDSLTISLFASGVSQALYSETMTSGDWGVCSANYRLRRVGPPGGVREISITRQSTGDENFYLYLERVEYGDSNFDYVEAIDSYLLQITMSTSGQVAEWQVEIGPELSVENFSSGYGDDVRSVVRYNR